MTRQWKSPISADSRSFDMQLLTRRDVGLMEAMSTMFGEAFDEVDTYCSARPGKDYLECFLGKEHVIALAATKNGDVIGGLVAYEFVKFEQQRSEIYIYDLAVAAPHRRQGIATALIAEVRKIAAARGAHVIFIRADSGDEPAIALYSKFGRREEVLHFDIDVS